ncbi:MAG: hypothetical protein V2I37_12740, partial [Marinilabiliaceae bacterium]|nr:hypothetical protein [Marinilabiliaceae bacterium]
IKILKKEGFDWANHTIKLYNTNKINENIGKVTGVTYNLEGKKVTKSKLSNKSIFKERLNEYYNSVKFTMPDIQEGSVIEFKYTITSEYLFNLPEWYFQYSIPVMWSEFNAEIPEYYEYKQFSTGNDPIQVNQQTRGQESIIMQNSTAVMNGRTATSEIQREEIKYLTSKYRMVAMDVPAFITEPMLTTRDNYILKVKFELSGENFPGQKPRMYSRDWSNIDRELKEHSFFGQQLGAGGLFLNKPIKTIQESVDGELNQMIACFEFIKNNMKWNGFNSIYTSSLRNAFQYKTGTVADINLMLTVMLRKAGFEAYPVILSTRSNGIVNMAYPMLSSFNYVITLVQHGGKSYLLDATDSFSKFNLLPERCLNGKGRVAEMGIDAWVDLNPSGTFSTNTEMDLVLDDNGNAKGSILVARKDYSANDKRKDILAEKSEEDYIAILEKENQGLEIDSYKFENLNDVYESLIENYEVSINGTAEATTDHIYLNPMYFERMEGNLFKLEDRRYPIDYAFPRHEMYKLTLVIPEGYTVEETPENMSISFKGGSAVFSYDIKVSDNIVNLNSAIHINKTLFMDTDYKELKEFYNNIVKKHAEMIALKKN